MCREDPEEDPDDPEDPEDPEEDGCDGHPDGEEREVVWHVDWGGSAVHAPCSGVLGR